MKKLIASLCLILVLFLCACGEEPYIKSKIALTHYDYVMPQSEPQWVTLYYPNEDNTKLFAFSQKLTYKGSFYDAIMNALLSGTEEGYVSPFPNGVSVRSTMLRTDILYIDLSWQFNKMKSEQFFACVSVLVNTFCSLNEVSFVNITVEGAQLTAPQKSNRPIMLLSKHTASINQLTQNYGLTASAQTSFYGVVFDKDATGTYLLPKTTTVNVSDDNYALALISSLITKSVGIFPEGFLVKTSPTFTKNTLFVELICPNDWEYSESWLGKDAIVCTLSTLYPDLKNIRLTVKDAQGNVVASVNSPCTDSYNSIRCNVWVISPKSDQTGLTKSEMLVLNMPSTSNVTNFLNEYVLNITPEFRSDVNIVNSASVSNDTVIIDLSASYFNYFYNKDLTQQQEYAIIYSLITTACTFTGTLKAQLLEDSKLRSTFCGHIKIDKPLLTLSSEFLNAI